MHYRYVYCIVMQDEFLNRLVNGPGLLQILFDDNCRPTMRWLNSQKAAKVIPHVKIGRLVFYDPPAVRAALANGRTAKARK